MASIRKEADTREIWSDRIKGIASVGVVHFHVVLGCMNAGIECSALLRVLQQFVNLFALGVFFFISAYLYEKYSRVSDWRGYLRMVKKKLINLGIPYLLLCTIYVFVNSMMGSEVNTSYGIHSILNLLLEPVAQYWYLRTLILFFIIFPLLQAVVSNVYIILGIFLVLRILMAGGFYIPITHDVQYYGILFAIGIWACRVNFPDRVKKGIENYRRQSITLLMLVGAVITIYLSYVVMTNNEMQQIPYLLGSLLSTLLMVALYVIFSDGHYYKLEKLAVKYSFQIYLLHTFFTSAIRIVLLKLGVTSGWIHWILGLGLGVFGSMLCALIAEKLVYPNILFFPEATCKKIMKRRKERKHE